MGHSEQPVCDSKNVPGKPAVSNDFKEEINKNGIEGEQIEK